MYKQSIKDVPLAILVAITRGVNHLKDGQALGAFLAYFEFLKKGTQNKREFHFYEKIKLE